jgi:hypothetical protein
LAGFSSTRSYYSLGHLCALATSLGIPFGQILRAAWFV